MGRERGKNILVDQRVSEGNSKCVSRVFSCLAVLLEYTYCTPYILILPPSYKWKATTSVGSYLSYVFLVIRHHYQSNLYKNFIDAHSFNKCVHGHHSGENGSRRVLGQHLRSYSNPQIGMRERELGVYVSLNAHLHCKVLPTRTLLPNSSFNWGLSIEAYDPMEAISIQTTTGHLSWSHYI